MHNRVLRGGREPHADETRALVVGSELFGMLHAKTSGRSCGGRKAMSP